MKIKRFLAGLLALSMVFGTGNLTNVSAAETTGSSEEELLDSGLTEGTYTDETADADTEYEYIVVGSDGSTDTVSTDLMENLEIVYEKLTWTTGSFGTSVLNEDGESYLIVGAHTGSYHEKDAFKAEAGLPHYSVAGYLDADGSTIRATDDTVSGNLAACEWAITAAGTEGEYYISPASDSTKYLQILSASKAATADDIAATLTDTQSVSYITVSVSGSTNSDSLYTNSVYIGGVDSSSATGYLNARDDGYAGTWTGADNGSCLYLYEKMYTATEAAIAEVTAGVGDTSDCTQASVAAYNTALAAAQESYETPEAANEALTNLETAVAALVPMKWVGIVEAYYQKAAPTTSSATDTAVQEVPSGDYLIVGTNSYASKAITTNEDLTYTDVTVNGDKITPLNEALEWKFTWTGSGYTVESVDDAGYYLNFTDENTDTGVKMQEVDTPQSIQLDYLHGTGGDTYQYSLHVGTLLTEHTYLNNRGGGIGSYNGWYSNSDHDFPDNGSSFLLYKETYGILSAKIEEAITGVGEENTYTEDSWTTYNNAKTAAEGGFDSKEEAYIAYVELLESVNSLVLTDQADYVEEAYVKVEANVVEDGIYVISAAHYNTNNLIKSEASEGGLAYYTEADLTFSTDRNRVSPVNEIYEWEIICVGDDEYMIVAADGDGYMSVSSGASISTTPVILQIVSPDSGTTYVGNNAVCIGNGSQWLNHQTVVKTYHKKDAGSSYYLYERAFVVDSDKLTEITADVGEESTYTTESWTAYSNALTAAQGEFATADAAYAAYTALADAKAGLDEANYSYTMKELYDAICAANGGEFLFSEEVYTSDSGKAYRDALEAARGTFTTEAEKVQALENLVDAVEALSKNMVAEACFPTISWEVTEDANRRTDTTDDGIDDTTLPNYVPNINYVNTEEMVEGEITFKQYEALTWTWSQISRLVKDEDYRVTPVWSEADNGMRSREFSAVSGGDWKTADVYKISGEFTWPAGYDLHDTTIVLDSVNDFYYRDIYEYISDEGMGDYFPLGQVLPVNDDVYVVMWVGEEGDKPTLPVAATDTTEADDGINNHLAFWSGTSGKGIWSQSGWQQNDWSRVEPATFMEWNLQGERAFYHSYPNIIGTGEVKADGSAYTNSDVVSFGTDEIDNYLSHTDGWYTLVDTTAVNSVLRSNNPNGIAEGTKVHIDLYVMNNDGEGMIDELQIELFKEKETETEVIVNYYLNEVSENGYLGTEELLNQEYGTSVTLLPGTGAAQLNSYKAEAIYQAGYKEVTDGVQLNELIVTEGGNNVINVLYTVKDAKIVYLQAASGEFVYSGSAHQLNTVTITEYGVEGSATAVEGSAGKYTLPDGNIIENVYSYISETNPGIYENNFAVEDGQITDIEIAIKDTAGNDVTNTYTVIKIPGTLKITYAAPEVTKTYDFGVDNVYTDVLAPVELNATVAVSQDYVTVSDSDNDAAADDVSYAPPAVNTGETVELELTFAGDYKVTKTLNFLPASNVFYEENFADITGDGNDATAASWTTDGTAGSKTVTDNDSTEYGYAKAYDTIETYSNSSALKATLSLTDGTGIEGTTAKTLDAVTFTFTGTGFDLISKCGTDTGMLLVKVVGAAGTTKAYLVDTYFTGDGEYIASDSAAAYQVPVIREMDLTYDTYTVTVYGYLVNTAGAMTATYSMDDSASAVPVEDILMIALEDCGMSDIDTSEVEVTYMDDNSVLNGGSGNVYAESGFASFSMTASEETTDTTSETATTDTACVYVDGFRVYQPLTDETAYPASETGVKYASLFDFVQTSANDLSILADNTAVYIEYDGATDVSAIADYKNQGPENEVYLSPKSAIAFVVDNYKVGDTVQVSAKAVTNGVAMTYTTGTDDNLNYVPLSVSTTEMYYTVEAAYDSILGEYYVQITNDGNTGVLAISGVKLKSTIQPMASASAGEVIVENMNADASKFAPEKMTISVPKEVTVGRTFSISVSTSLEVDHLAIDFGDGEGKQTLNATNTKAVKAKRAKVYKFSTAYCELETGTYTYTLYAYDADGNESAPVEVTVKVVEQQ